MACVCCVYKINYNKIMEKIMNWLSLKRLFIISSLGTICFLLLIPQDVSYFVYDTFGANYVHVLYYVITLLMFTVATLISSIVIVLVEKKRFLFGKGLYLFIYLFIYNNNISMVLGR